ncbi:MAG: cupin domain-containing protein [Mucilaginibacter sp.]
MEELIRNNQYRILKVELPAGTNMPRHFATSDAFIIVESGNALLIYKGETFELHAGANQCISSHEEHILKVIEDFKALIVLGSDGVITYSALK